MKKLIALFVAVVMIAGFTVVSAQNSENTLAGAKIVKAISITETSALHFGTMTIPTAADTVFLTTLGVRSCPGDGISITLLAQLPHSSNAAYTVSGSADAAYAIVLPEDGDVTISNGAGGTMKVDAFVARTTSAGADGLTGILDGSGADAFSVGAKLILISAQAFGVYSGNFDVTINYN